MYVYCIVDLANERRSWTWTETQNDGQKDVQWTGITLIPNLLRSCSQVFIKIITPLECSTLLFT
jgi:hypothetical protein